MLSHKLLVKDNTVSQFSTFCFFCRFKHKTSFLCQIWKSTFHLRLTSCVSLFLVSKDVRSNPKYISNYKWPRNCFRVLVSQKYISFTWWSRIHSRADLFAFMCAFIWLFFEKFLLDLKIAINYKKKIVHVKWEGT